MLTTHKPKVGTVAVFKLVTGEEIVAKIISDHGQSMVISKPISVALQPTGQVAMVPFMISVQDEGKLDINMSNVVIVAAARDEMVNAYISATSSIVPASSGDLNALKATDVKAENGGPAVGGFKLTS